MKNLYKYTLFALISVLLISCDQLIEIDQPGRLSPEATFETVSDLNAGLLGVYAQLDYTPLIQFNAVFTDEVSIGFDSGGQGLGSEYDNVLDPTTLGPSTIWTNWYDTINFATRVIDGAGNVTLEQGQQATFNSIVGQAHAIRAYAHLMLLTYFSEDITDNNSIGTIVITEIPDVQAALPRNTTGEVVAAINNDLDMAESLIPASDDNVTRFTRAAVTAIRARMAIYRENYAQAEQLSQELLDQFPLADQQEYTDMFRLDTDGEVIFKMERTVGDNYDQQGLVGTPLAGGWAGANFAFVSAGIDGSPYFEMGRTLYNLMNDSSDVRLTINSSSDTILDPNYPNSDPLDFFNNDIIPIDKYQGNVPGEGQPLMNDLKVFRASEMLFINAEAKVGQGDLAGAAQMIKQLRDARHDSPQPLPNYANAEEAWGDIMDERRVELAFEGHRYIDIRRLGPKANKGIDRDPLDCVRFGSCDVPGVNDHRFVFPIPLVELDGNQNIQQNPGYSSQ